MEPKKSLLGWFTKEGRVKNKWASALADSDQARSLDSLREVQQTICKDPPALTHLWKPFLDSFLAAGRVRALTEADLKAAEEMGDAVQSVSDSAIHPEQVWLRVVEARDARAEERPARELLTRSYNSRTASAEMKAHCARSLARRGSKGDKQTKIYLDHLRHAPDVRKETDVLKLLAVICEVDFDSPKVNIKRAGEMAEKLSETSAQVDGMHRALGMHFLLGRQNPEKAAAHFEDALESNEKDKAALIGLLAACTQSGDYDEVARIAEEGVNLDDPVVRGLVTLSATLKWLETFEQPGPPPAKAQAIESLNLVKYAGDKVEVAAGRLHLLEGNAERANEILLPLANRRRDDLRLSYYAAWASLLRGDAKGLELRYESLGDWPGRWMVACLMIDEDPTLAQSGRLPLKTGQVPARYSSVFQARLAVARATELTVPRWEPGADLEGDLEALRVVLACAVLERDRQEMDRNLERPLLARLPLADQATWRGLREICFGDQMQGRALLEEASVRYGYRRATMILAVHYLEQGKVADARGLLDRIGTGRASARIRLLRAYVDAREGRTEGAAKKLEELAAENEARAKYALGNLYLDRAEQSRKMNQPDRTKLYREQAAGMLQSALKAGANRLPADCEVLAACAEFLARPEEEALHLATLGEEVDQLDGARRKPWIVWNAAVSQMWCGDADDVCEAGEKLIEMLDEVECVEPEVLDAIAQAIARASIEVDATAQADRLMRLLDKLGARSPNLKRYHRLAVTAATRLRRNDSQTREKARQQAARLAKLDPGNVAITLLLSEIELENGNRAEAVTALQEAAPEDDFERQLCACLADLLQGRATSVGIAQTSSQGANLLRAAAHFAAGAADRGFDMIVTAMHKAADDTSEVVKLGKFIPSLCAQSAGANAPPALVEMIRKMADSTGDGKDTLTVARCAAAIGENDAACRLWEKALKREAADSPLRQEYAAYLCYLSVMTRNSGHYGAHSLHEAADTLRRAIDILEGGKRKSPETSSRSTAKPRKPAKGASGGISAVHFESVADVQSPQTEFVITGEMAQEIDAPVDSETITAPSDGEGLMPDEAAMAIGNVAQSAEAAVEEQSQIEQSAPDFRQMEKSLAEIARARGRAEAERVLDEWSAQLVHEGENLTGDTESVQTGVRKNYEAGIDHLRAYTRLSLPSPRILCACLDWYNNWCYDLHLVKDTDRIGELIAPARALANQLARLCVKGNGGRAENQALSRHFLLTGFTAADAEDAIEAYSEALDWNPADDNARDLLADAVRQVLLSAAQSAVELAQRKQFQQAYDALDSVEKYGPGKAEFYEVRAEVFFRHADALAEKGDYIGALERARKAEGLDPSREDIKEFISEVEGLATEQTRPRKGWD